MFTTYCPHVVRALSELIMNSEVHVGIILNPPSEQPARNRASAVSFIGNALEILARWSDLHSVNLKDVLVQNPQLVAKILNIENRSDFREFSGNLQDIF